MFAIIWNWIGSNIGTTASVVGVVFSCLAWVQAGKAKDAAQEAGNAVRTGNLAHSFSEWAVYARDLLASVRDLHFESAQKAATGLLGALSRNKVWQAGLQRQDATVEEIVRMLNLVNTYLTDKTIFEDKQAGLVEDCQSVYRKLNELAVSIEAQAEKL